MPSSPEDFKQSTRKPTSASQWKRASTKAVELELPSGNIALVRPIRITTMLAENMFPESLRSLVQSKIDPKSASKEATDAEGAAIADDLLQDPEKITSMFATFDKIVVHALVEPRVHIAPENDEDRDDELLYADDIDLDDKLYVFQFCVGGTTDLERFRAELGETVGSVENESGVPPTSE